MARRKRRKAAPAGRVLATGLSASAMLGIVSVLASQPPPSWELKTTAGSGAAGNGDTGQVGAAALAATALPASTVPASTVPVTTIVTRVEQRIIKVYDDGTPVGNGAGNTPSQGPAPAAPVAGNPPAPSGGQPPPAQPTPQPGTPPPAPPTVAPPPPPTAPPTTAAPVPKCKTSKC